MAGWGFILYEIFTGEAGGAVGDCSPAVASNFQTMRLIVTIGWAIYPLGYVLGTLVNMPGAEGILNVVYNIADFVKRLASSCPSGLQARLSPLVRRRLIL